MAMSESRELIGASPTLKLNDSIAKGSYRLTICRDSPTLYLPLSVQRNEL